MENYQTNTTKGEEGFEDWNGEEGGKIGKSVRMLIARDGREGGS